MPNVYERRIAIHYKDPDSDRLDKTLFSLMTSHHRFLLHGIRILPKNSDEWKQVIDGTRQFLENSKHNLDKKDIEEKIAKLASQEVIYTETDFESLHYNKKRLLYDEKLMGEVSVKRKAIDFFRPIPPATSRNMASRRKEYSYDGGFRDAVSEFKENGYTLTLWDKPWSGYDIQDGEIGPNLRSRTPLIKEATIDQIFEFAR